MIVWGLAAMIDQDLESREPPTEVLFGERAPWAGSRHPGGCAGHDFTGCRARIA